MTPPTKPLLESAAVRLRFLLRDNAACRPEKSVDAPTDWRIVGILAIGARCSYRVGPTAAHPFRHRIGTVASTQRDAHRSYWGKRPAKKGAAMRRPAYTNDISKKNGFAPIAQQIVKWTLIATFAVLIGACAWFAARS